MLLPRLPEKWSLALGALLSLFWKLPQPLPEPSCSFPPSTSHPLTLGKGCRERSKTEGLLWDEGHEFKGSSGLLLSGEQDMMEIITFSPTLPEKALLRILRRHLPLDTIIIPACACVRVCAQIAL